MIATGVPPELLGPSAALALSLLFNGLFYTGKILPRNAVPREDQDKLLDINNTYAAALTILTKSVDDLIAAVRYAQRNGNGGQR